MPSSTAALIQRQRVFNACFLFLHFRTNVVGPPPPDDLGEPLLKLSRSSSDVVSSICALSLHAALDLLRIAIAFDRCVVLVDRDALGSTEIGELHVLELEAEFFSESICPPSALRPADVLGLPAMRQSQGPATAATFSVRAARVANASLSTVLGDDITIWPLAQARAGGPSCC